MTTLAAWLTLAAAVLALVAATTPAGAQPAQLQERTLDNGLEVLVLEDYSAPLFTLYVWYRVGLRNEGEGERGLTHFLEHMAFKGSENLTGREMNRLVTERGGYLNGFTSMDYTAYVQTLPPDALDLALHIEAERMGRCLLLPEDIEAEKGVVLSEFAGAENDPSFLLRRELMAEQFPSQPYGRTVLGDKDDLRNLSPDLVASYYRRHYAPNNAFLVVVGAVSADEVFARVEQHFGGFAPGEPSLPRPNPGRGPTGERRVTLERPGRTSFLQVVYEAPPIHHPDHIALEVLQSILSAGRTSRLYRALVDTGLASSAGGWSYENPEPTVFFFQVQLSPGVEHERAQAVLDEVIGSLASELVEARELEKAKNQTKAHFVYESDGGSKLARQIGYYHLLHHHDYLRTFPEKVDEVTAEDIQRVVRTYFVPENRTVGWLRATGEEAAAGPGPAPTDQDPGARPAPALTTAAYTPAPAEAPGPRGERADASPPAGSLPRIEEIRLPNGLQVILQQNRTAPFVALYGNIMAGPTFDPPGRAGLAAFCAEMLTRGTHQRSWEEIREALEFVAADLSFSTGAQVATVAGRCLRDDLPLLLEALAEQLRHPSFPPEEIEKVRSLIIAGQERRDEDTFRVAEREFLAHLYPQGHPLHDPPLGTRESVGAITRDDLVAFHQHHYRPENTILALVGDFDPAETAALIARTLGDWERAGEPLRPEIPQVAPPAEPRVVRVPVPDKTQVDIALGFPGLSRRDPGFYAADLMNYVLGRGFMSRLNMRIREEMGLAYYVWSNFWAYWGPGPWLLQMGVDPAHADRALAAALEELERIRAEAPSEEELALWKDYVEGTVARRMETFAGIAQNLVLSAFYELGLHHPYEYPHILRAITAEQVHQAARQQLHPQAYLAVIAGPTP